MSVWLIHKKWMILNRTSLNEPYIQYRAIVHEWERNLIATMQYNAWCLMNTINKRSGALESTSWGEWRWTALLRWGSSPVLFEHLPSTHSTKALKYWQRFFTQNTLVVVFLPGHIHNFPYSPTGWQTRLVQYPELRCIHAISTYGASIQISSRGHASGYLNQTLVPEIPNFTF